MKGLWRKQAGAIAGARAIPSQEGYLWLPGAYHSIQVVIQESTLILDHSPTIQVSMPGGEPSVDPIDTGFNAFSFCETD